MNAFLQKIVGLCLIRLLLDWMLPEGEASSWASLGLELVMMLCMLEGFVGLARMGT